MDTLLGSIEERSCVLSQLYPMTNRERISLDGLRIRKIMFLLHDEQNREKSARWIIRSLRTVAQPRKNKN